MFVRFIPASGNSKTGPIPVSYTERESCPSTCPFYNKGCYAKYGPTGMWWRKVRDLGAAWDKFCKQVKKLPKAQLWRHNVAGDLPHKNGEISYMMLRQLIMANKGKRGFTYTHHELHEHNRVCLENANLMGFTVNVSCESIEQADRVMTDYKLPAVAVVNSTKIERFYTTESGRKVITCPAVLHEDVTCSTCGICQNAKRDTIVAFPAHGIATKTVNTIVS
jgi:hypothetical protein